MKRRHAKAVNSNFNTITSVVEYMINNMLDVVLHLLLVTCNYIYYFSFMFIDFVAIIPYNKLHERQCHNL
jgi:hypothetical protein